MQGDVLAFPRLRLGKRGKLPGCGMEIRQDVGCKQGDCEFRRILNHTINNSGRNREQDAATNGRTDTYRQLQTAAHLLHQANAHTGSKPST